jgi:endonuclease/exonuclease/phosphatase family metal-dependent hydrolase
MTNTKKKYTSKSKLNSHKYKTKKKLINLSENLNESGYIVKDNTNYIKSEISKMPKSIKDIIIINKPMNKQDLELPLDSNSQYNKIINSEAIDKLYNLMNKKCLLEKSLYDISTEIIIDGFIIRKFPKGINIYKGLYGFYTEKDILKYSKENLNKFVWFGNKYFSYDFAKILFGSLVSFKVIDDIYLIDFYNIHNIKKILEILESITIFDNDNDNDNKEKFIFKLKIMTGYDVSLLEQINYIRKNIFKWKEFWIYTNTYKKNYKTYNYCKLNIVDGLNPLYYMFTKDTYMVKLFNLIIININNSNIDGFFRNEIYSSINDTGKSETEEFIIKNSSLLKKLKFDYDDPLCWVNWKNNRLKDYRLRLSANYYNFNFILSEYYAINKLKLLNLNNYNILSYNVHNFINLNSEITYETNMNNIIKLINYYKNNLNIMGFQEMSFIDNKSFNFFYNTIKEKYPYYYNCSNGTYKNNNDIDTLSIFVFTNKKYESKIINLQLTNNDIYYITKKYTKLKHKLVNIRKTVRNIILLYTEYGKIAFIHLEIGLRETNDSKLNIIIKKFNSEIRIIMLKKILQYKPDIVIGDMNFTLDDQESKFLIKNNYYHQQNNGQNSTPYNRVDHCFISKEIYNKNNKIIENNKLLKCNYSDHLPMFQKLENIL